MTDLLQDFAGQTDSLSQAIRETHALLALICAELFLFLVRKREITILVKSVAQLSATEKREKERGLARSVLLEVLFFVPASLALFFVVVRPLLMLSPMKTVLTSHLVSPSASGLLGLLSYQFPFAAVRKLVTLSALHTLRSFATITIKELPDQ